MSLLTKPIVDITWDDVELFCRERIAENAVLDYKEDFPANLQKTLAAFANTLGGTVLIGVKADYENRPITPVKGIEFKPGLSERVTNIVLDNITPPFIPVVGVAVHQDGKRAVVIIRVPQSHQTPHAIAANTQVYYRTGNRNSPEEIATLDRVEWLRNNRQRSEVLKKALYEQAESRFRTLHQSLVAAIRRKEETAKLHQGGWLTVSLCPFYPKDRFIESPAMQKVYRQSEVPDYYHTGSRFPLPDFGDLRIVQDGLVRHVTTDEWVFHFELNDFGLYFYRQSIVREDSESKKKLIRGSEILCRLDEFLDSAVKFYQQLGYWGQLEFRACLEGVQGCGMVRYPDEHVYGPQDSIDPDVRFSTAGFGGLLKDEKPRLIVEAAQQLAWAFNWDLSAKSIDQYYVKYKGESVLLPDKGSN